MKEPERQLGVRIPATLYNILQDNAKTENKTFKQYIIDVLDNAKSKSSSKQSSPQSLESPENWDLAVDMGEFDLIIYESKSKSMAELARENAQPYFKYPLKVIQFKDARVLKWKMEEVLVDAMIQYPNNG